MGDLNIFPIFVHNLLILIGDVEMTKLPVGNLPFFGDNSNTFAGSSWDKTPCFGGRRTVGPRSLTSARTSFDSWIFTFVMSSQ